MKNGINNGNFGAADCPKLLYLPSKYRFVMADTSIFQHLDLGMFRGMEHTLFFEDEFMLADNFGLPANPASASKFMVDYPFKLTFTLLLLCTQGRIRVQVNLREFLLEANQVLILLPNAIGQCLEVSDDCQVAMIAYRDDKHINDSHSDFHMLFYRYLSEQSIIPLSSEERDETLAIYHAMWRKVEQPDYAFTRDALNGYMQVLACNGYQWMLNRRKQMEHKPVESRSEQLFERFVELVQRHFRQERAISFYASQLCITPKYLSRRVHEASGRYAGEWIRDCVILEAKALLKSKAYTVQQISEQLNFPNPSFFGKYFKATAGCSPRKYMQE